MFNFPFRRSVFYDFNYANMNGSNSIVFNNVLSGDTLKVVSEIRREWNSIEWDSTANGTFTQVSVDTDRFIAISDLHIPYHRQDIVDNIVRVYGGKNYNLIINGDLLDMEALSSFPKSKQAILEEEYRIALEMLDVFRSKFNKVYLIEGNHERRLKTALMKIPEFVQASFMYEPDILASLSNGVQFEKGMVVGKLDFDNVYYYRTYALKFGKDFIILHPNNYRATPMGTTRLAIDFVLSYDKNIRYLVMGHTHQMGMINYLGVTGYEQGCLSRPLPYESSGRISLKRTQNGFVEIYFDTGEQKVSKIDLVNI